MQFFTIAALFAATAIASPAHSGSELCGSGGLLTNPLCCGTNILDVAVLDCHVPHKFPGNWDTFSSICAQRGSKPKCCALPIAGQALLCRDPVGA